MLVAKNVSLRDGTLSLLPCMGFGCPIFRRRQPEKSPIDLINSLPASGSTEYQITRDIGAVATQHGRGLAHRSGGMGRRRLQNHLNSDNRLRVLKIIGQTMHLEILEMCARLERTVVSALGLTLREPVKTPLAKDPAYLDLASLAYFKHSFSEPDKPKYSGVEDNNNMIHPTCFNIEGPHDPTVRLIHGQLSISGNLFRKQVFSYAIDLVLHLPKEQLGKVDQPVHARCQRAFKAAYRAAIRKANSVLVSPSWLRYCDAS
ncbi:hypothetical protein EST38_g5515 [Candolleomyces aberdarensis]|uniref:Uncharacterized protein n=1 Tax=Candolleomyces aberdarensis TaxID=2316362 RepID=A0A4Q2DKB7_9AGAR|nr:hypothetical protein EST38_g5515 [Candolleomyces aberdarensis]